MPSARCRWMLASAPAPAIRERLCVLPGPSEMIEEMRVFRTLAKLQSSVAHGDAASTLPFVRRSVGDLPACFPSFSLHKNAVNTAVGN